MNEQDKKYFSGEMSEDEKKEYEDQIGKDIESGIEESLERRFGCDDDPGWWEERSIVARVFLGIGMAILGIGFAFLMILVVMKLWNWLIPDIFGWTELTYWKAGGLMLLCWILFKNWNFGNNEGKRERRRKRELKRYMH